MHEQIFISGVWHSGTSLIAEIAKLNGYDLGKATNSKNDNNFAWRGPVSRRFNPETGFDMSFVPMYRDYDDLSVKSILEKSWPFDTVDKQENELFKDIILKSCSFPRADYNCCKLPGLSLMTPHIAKAFPEAPIIHVVRNPFDISLSKTDNYFLSRLIEDKTVRENHANELYKRDTIHLLFHALGHLEWAYRPAGPNESVIRHERKSVYWNILYCLRWVLMIDRLSIDLRTHNIKNHHIIKFENIVSNDLQEIDKLRQILGIKGDLKMPPIDNSRAYKYRTNINKLKENVRLWPQQRTLYKHIYRITERYLEVLQYDGVKKFMDEL